MPQPQTEKDFLWSPSYGYPIKLPLPVVGNVLAPMLREHLSRLLSGYGPKASDQHKDDRIIYMFILTQGSSIQQYLCNRPLAIAVREILYCDMKHASITLGVSCWRSRIALKFCHAFTAWRPVVINDESMTIKAICDNLRAVIAPQKRWAQA